MFRNLLASIILSCLSPVAMAGPCPPQISGQGQLLTANALPWIEYTAPLSEFAPGYPGLAGKPVHPQILIVELKPTATVGQANGMLCSLQAQLLGAHEGAPEISGGILAIRLPTTGHADLAQKLSLVRQNPYVQRANVETILEPDQVPYRAGTWTTVVPDWWYWFPESSNGNWGMIALHAPQMWNLADAMFKEGLSSTVTILDGGFSDASMDITYDVDLSTLSHYHGTHVAGIIGAEWGNNHYVDGIHPNPELVVANGSSYSTWWCFGYQPCVAEAWGEAVITDIESVLRAAPDTHAMNMSLGFNWQARGIDSDTSTIAQNVADDTGDMFISAIRSSEERGRYEMPVFVVSAGNDDGRHARNNSPMTSAALRDSFDPVIVVEALSFDLAEAGASYPYTLADYSNIGGHLSAPGSDVLSLTNTLETYSWGYAYLLYESGTSMASPHIAGLVGALYALDPSLARPTSATNPVLDLLRANDVAVGGGAADMPLAFESAMDLDRLTGTDEQLLRLLDIDDGTPDGNQRLERDPDDPTSTDAYEEDDADGDGGPGDGRIDMADFRRWRDWKYQLESIGDLDGDADHPKKDPNNDGRLDDIVQENTMARGDFNGDGWVSDSDTRYVPGAIDATVTDLGMLMLALDDPDYTLLDLWLLRDSGDIEVWPQKCPSGVPGPSVFRFSSTVVRVSDGATVGSRNHGLLTSREVYTVESSYDDWPMDYEVTVDGYNLMGALVWSETTEVGVTRGGDVFLTSGPCEP